MSCRVLSIRCSPDTSLTPVSCGWCHSRRRGQACLPLNCVSRRDHVAYLHACAKITDYVCPQLPYVHYFGSAGVVKSLPTTTWSTECLKIAPLRAAVTLTPYAEVPSPCPYGSASKASAGDRPNTHRISRCCFAFNNVDEFEHVSRVMR